MKRKLLLFVCAVLTSVGMWADGYTDYLTSENGWTQVTSTEGIVTDGTYVYVIALKDVNTRVVSLASEVSTGQVTTSIINGQPTAKQMWYIENDTYSSGGYALKSLANKSKYITASTWAWDAKAEASAKNAVGTCYSLLFDGSYNLTITTNSGINTDAGRYWGWWNPENPGNDGYNLAGNKSTAMNFALYKKLYAGVSGSDSEDYTPRITNPSFENGDLTGWSVTNSYDTKVTTSTGNYVTSGIDGTYLFNNWWQGTPLTQTVSGLPNGRYKLTVSLASSDDNADAKLFILANGHAAEADVTITKNTKGTFNDYNREFDVTDGTAVIGVVGGNDDGTYAEGGHWWYKADNFRLSLLYAYATSSDYTALNTAISEAAAHTLGFESGEYAPYNNVDRLTELAAARAIDQEASNTKESIDETIATLESGVWTANATDVECVYNGDFSEGQGSAAADIQNYGWTRTNNWGQFRNDSDNSSTSKGTSYYNQPGSLQYGNAGYYTMPLKANTIYQLTFKYASWEANSNNSVTASVLKSGEGMAEVTYGKNAAIHTTTGAFVTKTILFVTTTAGDYVLTLANNGNTVITDVSITKVADQTLTLPSETQYAAGTYPAVTLSGRSFSDSERWYTLCVPFAFDKTTFSEVKELSSIAVNGENITMVFADASSTTTAGRPYLVQSENEEVTFTNVEMDSSTEAGSTTKEADGGYSVTYLGTFSNVALTSSNSNAWVVSNNALYNVDSNVNVGPYRAYFTVTTPSPVKGLSFGFDDVDAIQTITNSLEPTANSHIYNLAGQRMSKPAKGINIVNGKKVIIK